MQWPVTSDFNILTIGCAVFNSNSQCTQNYARWHIVGRFFCAKTLFYAGPLLNASTLHLLFDILVLKLFSHRFCFYVCNLISSLPRNRAGASNQQSFKNLSLFKTTVIKGSGSVKYAGFHSWEPHLYVDCENLDNSEGAALVIWSLY